MGKLQVVYKKPGDIIPYERNPRKNDSAVDAVANSIKEFGFKVPVVIDKDGVIVCGHTRVKAAKKLKLEEIPCIMADDLDEEQIKAFRLADNKTSELSEWDNELLALEMEDIFNIDMSEFGFEMDEDDSSTSNPYTDAVKIPQYEPSGEPTPIEMLVDKAKTDFLLEEIEASDLPDDEKDFLKLAAQRHLAFNYKRIADYYANASEEMQRLMERSALVIIDYNDAIANGYSKLNNSVQEMFEDVEE